MASQAQIGVGITPSANPAAPLPLSDDPGAPTFKDHLIFWKGSIYKISIKPQSATDDKVYAFTRNQWKTIGDIALQTLSEADQQRHYGVVERFSIDSSDQGFSVNTEHKVAGNPTPVTDSYQLRDDFIPIATQFMQDFVRFRVEEPSSQASPSRVQRQFDHIAEALCEETAQNLDNTSSELESHNLVRALTCIGSSPNGYRVACDDHSCALAIAATRDNQPILGTCTIDPNAKWFIPIYLNGHYVALYYTPANGAQTATLSYYDSLGKPLTDRPELQEAIEAFKSHNHLDGTIGITPICPAPEQTDGVSCGAVLAYAHQLANQAQERPKRDQIIQFRKNLAEELRQFIQYSATSFRNRLQTADLKSDPTLKPKLTQIATPAKIVDQITEPSQIGTPFELITAEENAIDAMIELRSQGTQPILITYADLKSETTFDLQMRSGLGKQLSNLTTPGDFYERTPIFRESFDKGYRDMAQTEDLPVAFASSPEFSSDGLMINREQFTRSIHSILAYAKTNNFTMLVIGDHPIPQALSAPAKALANQNIGQIYQTLLQSPEFKNCFSPIAFLIPSHATTGTGEHNREEFIGTIQQLMQAHTEEAAAALPEDSPPVTATPSPDISEGDSDGDYTECAEELEDHPSDLPKPPGHWLRTAGRTAVNVARSLARAQIRLPIPSFQRKQLTAASIP